MMLHKKSSSRRLLKLIALVPIVGIAIALNAETVTDVVYEQPEKQVPIKKGKKNATIKTGSGQDIQIVETKVADDENRQASDVETFIVKGTVFDGSQDEPTPIPGAIVRIEGSKTGTVTDREGNFRLEVAVGDRIEVMYVGFETFSIGASKAYAQSHDYLIALKKEGTPTDRVFDVVEEMPQFPGGVGKLMEYLSVNLRYPKEAADKGLQGRVIVNFIVERDGSITNAKVWKSVDPALDAEALRLVNAMPKWSPGRQGGEPMRVKYTIPITFRLDNGPRIPAMKDLPANQGPEVVAMGYHTETAKNGLQEEHPLVIVDDKEMPFEQLGKIDPKTIDHMEVLKSQAAIEKYGEKGKNGVILITTKESK